MEIQIMQVTNFVGYPRLLPLNVFLEQVVIMITTVLQDLIVMMWIHAINLPTIYLPRSIVDRLHTQHPHVMTALSVSLTPIVRWDKFVMTLIAKMKNKIFAARQYLEHLNVLRVANVPQILIVLKVKLVKM